MAKRQSLKEKLRQERAVKQEQEPLLAKKVSLPKTSKNISRVAKQADSIHKNTPALTTPDSPKKIIRKSKEKIASAEVKERVTVWLPKKLLKTLKIHLATEEKKITEYFTELVKKDLKIK